MAVSPLCESYDRINGNCLECISGYFLNPNGSCSSSLQSSQTQLPQPIQSSQLIQQIQRPFCTQTSSTGVCTACQQPYLLASDGYCYDQKCYQGNRGNCATCQSGYYISGSNCVIIPIQGCLNFTNNRCFSCNQGLNLIDGNCVQAQSQPQPNQQTSESDPYCRQLSPTGQCVACFQSYVLGSNNRCVLSNQQCASKDGSGRCLTCYSGYILQNGNCVASIGDPHCRSYSQVGFCLECANSYYLSNGICTLSSSLCASTDKNGICLGCYPGYSLRNGNCSIFIQDPNCKQYTNSTCTLCSAGFYMA